MDRMSIIDDELQLSGFWKSVGSSSLVTIDIKNSIILGGSYGAEENHRIYAG